MSKIITEELLKKIRMLQEKNQLQLQFKQTEAKEQLFFLMEECQQLAIEIGTQVEQLVGEGTKTVAGLENYCESIYQSFIALQNGEADRAGHAARKKELEDIYTYMLDELPDRKEVVFMPYKASMWDSLESVWLAARDDPALDVYVVPVPYYDKKPDGSFGEMHYEGDRYPKYVPVTDWQSYRVEERKPDIVFTHNPYDAGNFATSIYPDFYIRNLKKHAGRVVYVPYFVLGEYVAPALCMNAGVISSDLTILQSEYVRDRYIHHINQWVEENHYDKKVSEAIEKKIYALGSPKIDRLINYEKREDDLPAEWKEVIGDKKVILYNLPVAAILKQKENAMNKLQDVMDIFKEEKDVILWWRPHPLDIATVQSLRPQLLGRFRQMISEYKEQQIGIYDETPDVTRALVYADMYYGDDSSLVYMFGLQGKPIMFQNHQILYGQRKPIEKDLGFGGREQIKSRKPRDYIIVEEEQCGLPHAIAELRNHAPVLEEQKKAFRDCFINADGTAGRKIMAFVKEDLL